MIGIYYVLEGALHWGAYFIIIAAVFDFLDGFVARILKVHSEIGKQLDSLADLVTFGVLPSFILFKMLEQTQLWEWLPFFGLFIGIQSALRLAKFNVDTRQTDRFIGLPTPANAMLISTLPFLGNAMPLVGQWLSNPWFLLGLTLVLGLLLTAELPLLALKFKDYSLKNNLFRFAVIAIGLMCLIIWGLGGIPFLILAYILLSLLEGLVVKNA